MTPLEIPLARRPHVISLCTAHEVRWDFRDVLLDAVPAATTTESAWEHLREQPLDALWSHNPPPESARLARRLTELSQARQGVVLIAGSAIREVAAELPAIDALGTNLRRLLRGETLKAFDHALLAFDDARMACIGWVGEWSETAPLIEKLARLADETLPVLIRGETGTGKEVIARALHILGRRRAKPYLPVNCAELPESILESELFGHARGAFTGATSERMGLFEAASDGTVFLDEVGELPLPAQAKLLRLLEEHRVRRIGSSQPRPLACRVVAATNRDLQKEIDRGRFRADLFYRLRGSELVLRPLRERRSDILPLAELFADRAALRFRRVTPELAADAKLALLSHPWPGNVRELRQTIEVAVLSAPAGRIDSPQLGLPAVREPSRALVEPLLTARAVERAHILRALASTGGNKMAAAKILGLTRQSLQRRMIRHGIALPPERNQARSQAGRELN
jgi:transcriptional regulator with GAF, ATPase, and Fis domain